MNSKQSFFFVAFKLLIQYFWPNVPRKSELWASTEPVMVPPSVRPSRRWKSPNTPNTCAPSVERTTWSVKLSASGAAAQRTVASKLPEELGPTQQQLPPQSDPPSDVWESWGQKPNWNSVFYFAICSINKITTPKKKKKKMTIFFSLLEMRRNGLGVLCITWPVCLYALQSSMAVVPNLLGLKSRHPVL